MINRAKFRELVESREILVMPGAYDALSAKLIEASGFDVVYMTGYGQSASKLGAPDVGLMTMSEMAERAKDMCAAVSVPVICDGDTGFGNVVNLVRTVREYERAGAAAIQLEDQTMPKKCGHMLGRQVVDAEEMVNKIRAAVAARQDPDFLIIARTDVRTNHGVEEAIRRARLYEQAGADIIFVESLAWSTRPSPSPPSPTWWRAAGPPISPRRSCRTWATGWWCSRCPPCTRPCSPCWTSWAS